MRLHLKILSLISAFAAVAATPALAQDGYADSVVDYFNSGANPAFPGPYGGTFPGSFPVSVSTSVVLGPDGPVSDFLSLPTGSYVTVAFLDEYVIDGVGDDIFIGEVGAQGERANVFVTSDFINFVLLGVANDAALTPFDLASIGWTGQVAGVRITGLDNLGASPGFDVAYVRALPSAVLAVPEPATWGMMLLGFGAIGMMIRRRRTNFATISA